MIPGIVGAMSAPPYGADVTISSRFCGPPSSGNGGYTAGALAGRVQTDGAAPHVQVTLRQPPPLEAAMQVQQVDGRMTLQFGGSLIADASAVQADLEPVEAVSPGEARTAMATYPGLISHPFPTCFVCGTERSEGDGLRIFPGPVGPDRVASAWTPAVTLAETSDVDAEQRVGLPTAWAALDCVGGWAGDMTERLMVLGRMTAQVDELPVVGEPHVVVGAARGREGRKTFTASTLYDSDGRIVARAEHVWITVDPSAFR